MSSVSSGPGGRSEFVTVLAWIFILLSRLGIVMLTFEFFLFGAVMPHIMEAARSRGDPVPAGFVFDHMQLVLAIVIPIPLATLVISIGLLKRRNWARICFIVLMALNILGSIGGVLLQHYMMSAMPMFPPNNAPPEFRARLQSMMADMQVFGIVFALGFAALYTWIIMRLLSADVRREFTARA